MGERKDFWHITCWVVTVQETCEDMRNGDKNLGTGCESGLQLTEKLLLLSATYWNAFSPPITKDTQVIKALQPLCSKAVSAANLVDTDNISYSWKGEKNKKQETKPRKAFSNRNFYRGLHHSPAKLPVFPDISDNFIDDVFSLQRDLSFLI